MVSLAAIREARARIRPFIRTSPASFSLLFSEVTGTRLFFKLENSQATGSFKERGALARLLVLNEQQRQSGVIAASAGNHAQGLAYHARNLGIATTVVMPRSTPLIKVTRTQAYGARTILRGSHYDEAFVEAQKLAHQRGLFLIHGFDDPEVIAGQGSIGLEILEQVPEVDAIVVPVGGGGLIAGVAAAIKALKPSVAIYGVQTGAVPGMVAALAQGRCVTVDRGRTMAEGIAVATAGSLPLAMIRDQVDAMVTVDEEEIAEAVLGLLEKEKTVAEGAGAVPLAALLHRNLPVAGKTVVAIVSGGNIDVNILSRIIDRGLAKSGRTMRLLVAVPDVPGSLARILALVADQAANILDITHDRTTARLEFGRASVEIVAETRGPEHQREIRRAVRAAGFELR